MRINLQVNGEACSAEVMPATSLAEMIRETMGMTGTKQGCDTGGCGACTVILDGKVVYSCMTPAWKAEGRQVETVEGLERGGKLHPLQEAFIRESAPQCGYCTAGILMAAKALLDVNPRPTDAETREALAGVICRCTGYLPYLKAIHDASEGNSSA